MWRFKRLAGLVFVTLWPLAAVVPAEHEPRTRALDRLIRNRFATEAAP